MTPAALFAVDPVGLGGVVLRVRPGPARDAWLAELRSLLPAGAPVRRVPIHIAEGRLLGGLDLAATLAAGRPMLERGVLAEADGGVVVLAMAERISAGTAARIAAVLDAGEVATQRDGLERRSPAAIGIVAFDEGLTPDETLPPSLQDRLAFHLADIEMASETSDIAAARSALPSVTVPDDIVDILCTTAVALGIASLRAPLLALRAARAAAALDGRATVSTDDAALAARLVLAPRATVIPAPETQEQAPPEPETPEPTDSEESDDREPSPEMLADIVLQAAAAAIPPGLLARLQQNAKRRATQPGSSGAASRATQRGRPAGTRAGDPGAGKRLNLIETLRAAAPWQRLRDGGGGIRVQRDDFRVTHLKQRSETTTIFVVDASGSAAFHRLAEAKGAIELLLADCYVRRDRVALLAFRGLGAQLLLPPTRSLVRAKRSLAGLPGGGGTPLAAGIEAGCLLADSVRRQGGTPALVMLTDGQANIGQDGKPGRQAAARDADLAARRVRVAGHAALLVDTSPRPAQAGQRLADAMGAQFVALPFANAAILSQSVRAAMG